MLFLTLRIFNSNISFPSNFGYQRRIVMVWNIIDWIPPIQGNLVHPRWNLKGLWYNSAVDIILIVEWTHIENPTLRVAAAVVTDCLKPFL